MTERRLHSNKRPTQDTTLLSSAPAARTAQGGCSSQVNFVWNMSKETRLHPKRDRLHQKETYKLRACCANSDRRQLKFTLSTWNMSKETRLHQKRGAGYTKKGTTKSVPVMLTAPGGGWRHVVSMRVLSKDIYTYPNETYIHQKVT